MNPYCFISTSLKYTQGFGSSILAWILIFRISAFKLFRIQFQYLGSAEYLRSTLNVVNWICFSWGILSRADKYQARCSRMYKCKCKDFGRYVVCWRRGGQRWMRSKLLLYKNGIRLSDWCSEKDNCVFGRTTWSLERLLLPEKNEYVQKEKWEQNNRTDV